DQRAHRRVQQVGRVPPRGGELLLPRVGGPPLRDASGRRWRYSHRVPLYAIRRTRGVGRGRVLGPWAWGRAVGWSCGRGLGRDVQAPAPSPAPTPAPTPLPAPAPVPAPASIRTAAPAMPSAEAATRTVPSAPRSPARTASALPWKRRRSGEGKAVMSVGSPLSVARIRP